MFDTHGSKDNDLCLDEVETLNSIVSVFCQQAAYWSHIVDTIGCIDVILGFAISANLSEGSTCRPFFVSAGLKNNSLGGRIEGSILSIKGLWHPYAVGGQGGVAVPNDVDLGNNGEHDCPHAMLLTGPNMGGKSTLLRATYLTVIMAQLGCYVPCESCALSPADVIFTRIGASDHIMSGESTFLIECMEAASVLRYATEDSLVVLDELGRGTYTFDGYAFAYAVKNPTARVEHEASTSKSGEDQLFYFQQRGIDPEKAVAAIINGFCRVVFNELPLEFVAEVNQLMSLKLEGSVG